MERDFYMLVNSKVLPEVFKGVIAAKELLSSGKVSNTSKAVKSVGISRSAYYKYKDNVFRYESGDKHELTISATLLDKAGVFSAMTAVLSNCGASIITVNQNKPINGTAAVTLTVRTNSSEVQAEQLISKLKEVDGIVTIKEVN